MRITDIKVTLVSLPFTEAETWIWGRREGITNALLEVTTDEDVTGIGECPGHPTVALVRAVLEHMHDAVVGEDPTRIEHVLGVASHAAGSITFGTRRTPPSVGSRSHCGTSSASWQASRL